MPRQKGIKNLLPVNQSQSIRNFFEKSETVNKEKADKEIDKFYKNCLNEEICSIVCKKEKEEIKKKTIEIKEKIALVESAIETCRSIMLEKDIEISKLQKETPLLKDSQPEPMFNSFSNEFSREQINQMKSISTSNRGDSTFINFTIKCLYSGNLESLQNKTSCDRNDKSTNKTAMTPHKKKVIMEIYKERLSNVAINLEEKNTREKKLNKLIKDAFVNITKSLEIQKIETEALAQLDLNK